MKRYVVIGCVLMLGVVAFAGCAHLKEAINVTYDELKPETREDWLFLAELVLKAVRSEEGRLEGVELIGDKLQVDLLNPTQQALDAVNLWKEVVNELAGRTRSPQEDFRVYAIINDFEAWKHAQEEPK